MKDTANVRCRWRPRYSDRCLVKPRNNSFSNLTTILRKFFQNGFSRILFSHFELLIRIKSRVSPRRQVMEIRWITGGEENHARLCHILGGVLSRDPSVRSALDGSCSKIHYPWQRLSIDYPNNRRVIGQWFSLCSGGALCFLWGRNGFLNNLHVFHASTCSPRNITKLSS
jgi:hypothetical protein